MKKRLCSIISLVLLALMLLSACGEAVAQDGAVTGEQTGDATTLDGVASYTEGIAGSVAAGSILDWVYKTVPGSSMPATSTYVSVSSKFTSTFTVGSDTFNTIPATNTTYLSLSGLPHPNNNGGQYYRLDASNSTAYPGTTTSGVEYLATQTAGVAIRFCTDATQLAIQADMRNCNVNFNHMAMKGIYGFDVYVGTGSNRTWVTNTQSQLVMTKSTYDTTTRTGTMSSSVKLPSGYKEVLICFPQYGGVSAVNIGLPSSAKIAAPAARSAKPICFYGTSITQGACSNRAGTSFTNILARMLDTDIRNLGFSGNGKGEQIMADYVANLAKNNEVSLVVVDYERNPSDAELLATHYNFYKTVRAANATIPIVFLSRPIYTGTPSQTDLKRLSIVMNTYQKAKLAGDANVYMLAGYEYFTPGMADLYTVDGTHPNDLGHYFMANKIYPILYNILYGDTSKIVEPNLAAYGGFPSYSSPIGYIESASVANVTWNPGWISPTKKTDTTQYDATTNAYNKQTNGVVKSLYSYTDVMTFPKAGTKVWYHIPASTYANAGTNDKITTSGSVSLVSYATSTGAFDETKTAIAGDDSNGYKVLYDTEGKVYYWQTPYSSSAGQYICYITREDNESIRFSINLFNQTSAPTIYYCAPDGPTLHLANAENYTKQKVETTWTGNKYIQWDNGVSDNDLPFVVSDVITIPKAGTTLVWIDDSMPDPAESAIKNSSGTLTGYKYCDANRAFAGGVVGIGAFTQSGTDWVYDKNTLRIRANNIDSNTSPVVVGGNNCYFDTTDGTIRCYYYTTTKDNETVRISYYGGFDHVIDTTTYTDTDTTYYVRPYDVYMYVPNN